MADGSVISFLKTLQGRGNETKQTKKHTPIHRKMTQGSWRGKISKAVNEEKHQSLMRKVLMFNRNDFVSYFTGYINTTNSLKKRKEKKNYREFADIWQWRSLCI